MQWNDNYIDIKGILYKYKRKHETKREIIEFSTLSESWRQSSSVNQKTPGT
jgi:hypothetical protein